MDEEEMDDKEEPSEESGGRRDRQKRMMTPMLRERQEHERTHIVAGIVSLQGQAILLTEVEGLLQRSRRTKT